MKKKKIILGVSGASGTPFALATAKALKEAGVELHMIMTDAAKEVLRLETDLPETALTNYADALYRQSEIAAAPASGSWQHDGMIICPCSMASLAAIAQGMGQHLLHRAADVTLKERRPLIVVPRETPLNRIHLTNMLALHDAGATIVPPNPGFYHRPQQITDIVNHIAGRILDQLNIEHTLFTRWGSKE
jgi:4-hydroxy-3-polyprenylbenzoate decarboxylase